MAPTTTLSPEAAALVERYGEYMSYPTAEKVTTISVRTLKRLSAQGDLPLYRTKHARVFRLRTVDVANLLERVN